MADTTKTDWKLGNWSGGINPYGLYNNVTTTPVLCKDGTYDYESNSPNARIDNSKTCINKGGRAEIKQIEATKVLCNDGTFDIQAREPSIGMGKVAMACKNKGGIAINQPKAIPIGSAPTTDSSKSMTKMHIGLFVGGVVVGYFLLKILKK